MRVLLALLLLLLAVPAARADEGKAEDPEVKASVAVVAEEAPDAPDLKLEEVKVPEARPAESAAADTQEMPRRGSFWWLVGVIVVAGIILAVVLD